jgi:Zn-dependent peptidase ImmA (M78 family)
MTEQEFKDKLEAIKQDVLLNLGEEKEVLKEMAEPALKKILTVIFKNGAMPMIKVYVEKSKSKLDDMIYSMVDDKVEFLVLDMIAQIKLKA